MYSQLTVEQEHVKCIFVSRRNARRNNQHLERVWWQAEVHWDSIVSVATGRWLNSSQFIVQ